MKRRIPSLQGLTCFEAAARHESYTRAADELAMTQSAVSRQIAQLEAFLGLTLFRRTRHGVQLTPAGQAYAAAVAGQLDTLERTTLDTMAYQGSGGTLNIAVVPTFGTCWLAPRLHRLRAQHPDLLVHVETRTRPFLFTDTHFDGAIFAGTDEQMSQWPGTQQLTLLREDIIAVCSPQLLPTGLETLTPTATAALPLLQQSTRPQAWRDWFEAHQVEAPLALSGPRYELFSMLIVAASAGMGCALIPRLFAQATIDAGKLVEVCPSPPQRQRHYYWVTPDPAFHQHSASLRQFQTWLLEQAQHPETSLADE